LTSLTTGAAQAEYWWRECKSHGGNLNHPLRTLWQAIQKPHECPGAGAIAPQCLNRGHSLEVLGDLHCGFDRLVDGRFDFGSNGRADGKTEKPKLMFLTKAPRAVDRKLRLPNRSGCNT
jgi:hypothetical protein